MTVGQHRTIQWITIALILLAGAGWYYRTQVRGSGTIGNDQVAFEAPLVASLDLAHGVGGPTFTRATVATVTDFEGLIKTVKSGEARFEGARRVENLLTYSEDFSNAVWSKTGVTAIANQLAPDGTMTATQIIEDTSTGIHSFVRSGILPSGRTGTCSWWIKAIGTPGVLRFSAGSNNGLGSVYIPTDNSWHRYSSTFATGGGQGCYTGFLNSSGSTSYTGDGASGFYVWHPQFEEVTGQANQNPSEYVSTNVKTAAPYHGANVDGVKYFSTQNGNTVASSIVTEATGSAIADGTLHGYVAEGARTNQLTKSEQLDDATTWGAGTVAMTVTANNTTAPNGLLTAEKFVPNTTNSGHYTFNNSSITVGTTYTQTIYAKAAGYNYIQITASSGFDLVNSWVNYDLSTGLIGSKGNGSFTSSITALPNSWYKITMTATANTSVTGRFAISVYNTDAARLATYAGNGSSGMYLWGGQLEAGAFASSYIPTTTASVTRNVDRLTYPSSGNVDGTKGSAYAEVALKVLNPSASQHAISTSNVGTSTDALIRIANDNGSFTTNDGTNTVTKTGLTGNATTMRQYVISWGVGGLKVTSQGLAVTTGTFDGTITTTNLSFGGTAGGANNLYGTIRNVKIWKKALTDAQLTNLTSATAAVSLSAVKKTIAKVPTKTSLVGYWSMDDGTGMQAGDASGQGNTGTVVSPTWVAGKLGQALSFPNASNSEVDVANSASLNNWSAQTIAFWVKFTAGTPILDARIMEKGNNSEWTLTTNSSQGGGGVGIITMVRLAVPTPNLFSTVALNDDKWHHVAVTISANDPATVTGYVDGVYINSASSAQPSSKIGNVVMGQGNGSACNCSLDDVRIYNRALSSAEVTTLYQSSAAKMNVSQNDKLTSGLVGQWSFNGPDVSGTTAYDRSGSGNNGTLTNGPTVTPGKVGQALSFDGVDDWVDLGDVLNLSLPISVSAWVKLDTLPSTRTSGIFTTDKTLTSVYNHSGVWLEVSTTGTVSVNFGDNTACGPSGRRSKSSVSVLSTGQWYHIVAVIQGATNTQLYIDGIDNGGTYTGTGGSIVHTTRHAAIGRVTDCGTGDVTGTDGSIDEVRVYNRALSSGEVTALYMMGR